MPTRANPAVRHPRSVGRFLADVTLTGHAVVAGAWLWLMPGGFSVDEPRFWVNAVLPWLVIAAVVTARCVPPMRGPVLAALATLWLSAAVTARIVFPESFRVLWLCPAGIAIILGVMTYADWRRSGRVMLTLALSLGGAAGAAVPLAERASPPATKPAGGLLPPELIETEAPQDQVFRLSDPVRVAAEDGSVRLQAGPRTLTVRPLLTFDSRSPDGCWVLFTDTRRRRGPTRQLAAAEQRGATVRLVYHDDARSALTVAENATRGARIDAVSHLPHVIWSHLNTFTELQIFARGALSVSFSPCPMERIEIRPMGYPFGKPARFAYLDAAGVFHVVEARDAEKGPYRTLASGLLAENAPLALNFFDDGVPIFRVALEDWAAQASRQKSPTAGWGVPENAIEFSLASGGLAQVFITLASTSVGRGYDSVGHAPGVYRNRLTIEALAE